MPGASKGLHEIRTRVICHLPVSNDREERAFFDFLKQLKTLRHQRVGVSGYTHSQVRPAVFFGYWWPDLAKDPIQDYIVLTTVDFLLDMSSPELSKIVRELKQTIRRCYRKFGSPQEEIWVVAHPILRQD